LPTCTDSVPRQGPGGDAEAELALSLANLRQDTPLNLADLGCGTGASTLRLAELVNAHITAVNQLAMFLGVLRQRAIQQGVAECANTVEWSDRCPALCER